MVDIVPSRSGEGIYESLNARNLKAAGLTAGITGLSAWVGLGFGAWAAGFMGMDPTSMDGALIGMGAALLDAYTVAYYSDGVTAYASGTGAVMAAIVFALIAVFPEQTGALQDLVGEVTL